MSVSRPPICAIAAVAQNKIIGKNGRLPWRIEADWEHFMDLTQGGCLLMGRTSFEDMQREPRWQEAGRTYAVVSRDQRLGALPGVEVYPDPESALKGAVNTGKPVWICGGADIYARLLPSCDRLHLTLIEKSFTGDTSFPEWRTHFPTTVSTDHRAEHGLKFSFSVWERAPH